MDTVIRIFAVTSPYTAKYGAVNGPYITVYGRIDAVLFGQDTGIYEEENEEFDVCLRCKSSYIQ